MLSLHTCIPVLQLIILIFILSNVSPPIDWLLPLWWHHFFPYFFHLNMTIRVHIKILKVSWITSAWIPSLLRINLVSLIKGTKQQIKASCIPLLEVQSLSSNINLAPPPSSIHPLLVIKRKKKCFPCHFSFSFIHCNQALLSCATY